MRLPRLAPLADEVYIESMWLHRHDSVIFYGTATGLCLWLRTDTGMPPAPECIGRLVDGRVVGYP